MNKCAVFYLMLLSSCATPEAFMTNMEGSWCGASSGEGIVCETWTKTETGWIGKGEWLEDGSSQVTENLQFLMTDSGWYYIAHPISAKFPTYFKVDSFDDHHLKVVNPKHDFPRLIQYTLSHDTLFVHLEGVDMNEEIIEEEYFVLKNN